MVLFLTAVRRCLEVVDEFFYLETCITKHKDDMKDKEKDRTSQQSKILPTPTNEVERGKEASQDQSIQKANKVLLVVRVRSVDTVAECTKNTNLI